MTRPKKKIDWKILNVILAYKPSLMDCAGKLDVSHDTIERAIKKKFKMTFVEYRTLKMANTRLKLVQEAINRATEGKSDKMLTKCLDNICGWTSTQNIEHAGEIKRKTNDALLTDDEIDKKIEALIKKSNL